MEQPTRALAESEANILERTVARLRYRWRDIAKSAHDLFIRAPQLGVKDAGRIRLELAACIEGRGGEVSSRARAAALGRAYLALDATGRHQFLSILAEFRPDRIRVDGLVQTLAQTTDDVEYERLTHDVRTALEPPALQVFRQFNSLPEGVKFLVDMRAELLETAGADPALRRLEVELREVLASWFDIGFLDLRRITWDAAASLLERLAAYEAVHEVRTWQDLKNRLDADRRCYAFFHPLMPSEPLIFIEVALVNELSDSVEPLLDQQAPLGDAQSASVAIFYSISNCQRGLTGISFGNALVKRVVTDLRREFPNLKTFATLSPIPGFRRWLERRGSEQQPLTTLLGRRSWFRNAQNVEAVKAPLLRLCAHYLVEEKRRGTTALDPVAHFHLSNGARMERINWLGDRSARGINDSAGMMVNYVYRIDQIDANHEAYATDGKIAASSSIRSLLG